MKSESPSQPTSAKATLEHAHHSHEGGSADNPNLASLPRETGTALCLAVLGGLARKRGYFSRSSIFLLYFVSNGSDLDPMYRPRSLLFFFQEKFPSRSLALLALKPPATAAFPQLRRRAIPETT